MKLTFSSITSGLVGGLVLTYVLFMGYVVTVGQQSPMLPTHGAASCFSFGHCQAALASNAN
jgi:hypothetical protein